MKDKTTAGILAIFFGAYGAHWFYMGNKEKGKKYLLITLLTFGVGAAVMGVMGIIDAVSILGMTDEEFQGAVKSSEGDVEIERKNSGSENKTVDVSQETVYENLKQAKELLDMGVITEQEFLEIKSKLLKK